MKHQQQNVEKILRFQLSLLHLFAANQASNQAPKEEAVRLEEMMARLPERN